MGSEAGRSVDKKKLVWLLSAALALGVSSTDIYLASLPRLAAEFRVDADWASLTLSFFSAGLAFGCLFCGFISDRFGRRPVYLGALAIYTITSLGIVFMPWLWGVLGLRFLQGVVTAVFVIVSRQIITDICHEEEQIRYTAMLAAGVVLSPALAPVLGAYIAYYSSWRMCFAFSGVFSLVLLVLLFRQMPETLAKALPLPGLGSLWREYQQLLSFRRFLGYSMIITFCFGAFFSFTTMSSFIYVQALGIDSRWFSKIFLLLALAYLVGNRLMNHLNKIGIAKEKLVWRGLLVCAVGTIVALLSLLVQGNLQIAVLLSAGIALFRAGYALLQAPAQVLMISSCPGRPGVIVGLIYFMQFVMGSLAGAGVAIFHATPLAATLVVMAGFIVLAMGAYYLATVPAKQAS